jgi:hypothetical protein
LQHLQRVVVAVSLAIERDRSRRIGATTSSPNA